MKKKKEVLHDIFVWIVFILFLGGIIFMINSPWSITGYATSVDGTYTHLNIWDDSDADYEYTTEQVYFYANYTNITDDTPLSSGTCYINISNIEYEMVYNSTTDLFEYNTSFSTAGDKTFIVRCNVTAETLNTQETATIEDYFDVFECRTLTEEGTYTMSDDIDCSSNCIIFETNNSVFNCDDYYISGSNSNTGILLEDVNNITITNCDVSDFDDGIVLDNADNNIFTNTNSFSNRINGFELTSSDNNIFTNTDAYENEFGSGFIFLSVSNNNSFENVESYFHDWYGFYVQGNNNSFTDVSCTSNYAQGFYIEGDYNILTDVSVINSSEEGFYITNSDNNTFTNIEVLNNYNHGFYQQNSYGTIINDSVLCGNNVSASSYYDVRILSGTITGNGNVTCNDSSGFSCDYTCEADDLWDPYPYQIGCEKITSPGEYSVVSDILNSASSTCINITVDDVTIDCQNYKIQHSLPGGDDNIAIWLEDSTDNVTIKNCEFQYWSMAVQGRYPTNIEIDNITVRDSYGDEQSFWTWGSGGIFFTDWDAPTYNSGSKILENITVKNSDFINCTPASAGGAGVWIEDGKGLYAYNNNFEDVDYAIYIASYENDWFEDVEVYNNNFSGTNAYANANAINPGGTASGTVKYYNNIVDDYYYGFVIGFGGTQTSEGDNYIIENNTVTNCDYGFYFNQGNSTTINRNNITSCTNGVYVKTGSYNNIIYDNYFRGNTNNVQDDGTNNKWYIEPIPGINIIGGSWLGGNYYYNILPLIPSYYGDTLAITAATISGSAGSKDMAPLTTIQINDVWYGEYQYRGARKVLNDAVTDVYYYNATGESWRCSSSTSWYAEKGCFPEEALIVGSENGVSIIDLSTNDAWMRFVSDDWGWDNMITGDDFKVSVLNGKLLVGESSASYGGLYVIDFENDEAYGIWNDDIQWWISSNQTGTPTKLTISQRNSGLNDWSLTNPTTMNAGSQVYEIDSKEVDGNDYVLAAIEGSVIQGISLTDLTIENSTYTGEFSVLGTDTYKDVYFGSEDNIYYCYNKVMGAGPTYYVYVKKVNKEDWQNWSLSENQSYSRSSGVVTGGASLTGDSENVYTSISTGLQVSGDDVYEIKSINKNNFSDYETLSRNIISGYEPEMEIIENKLYFLENDEINVLNLTNDDEIRTYDTSTTPALTSDTAKYLSVTPDERIFIGTTDSGAQMLRGLESNYTWEEDTTLSNVFDLDDYFFDPKGGVLTYGVSGDSNVDVDIDSNNLVSFSPIEDWYGTENITFTATDSLSNTVDSSEIDLIVTDVAEPAETESTGGSTGASGVIVMEGNDITEELNAKGTAKRLVDGIEYLIYRKNEVKHTIALVKIDYENKQATISVRSRPKTYVMKEGETVETDLDDDGETDLKITLDDVEKDHIVLIVGLEKQVLEVGEKVEIKEEKPTPETTQPTIKPAEKEKGLPAWLKIIGIILGGVIILGGITIGIIKFKPKKKNEIKKELNNVNNKLEKIKK